MSNTLPSTATPSLPQTSLAKKSTFGLLWLPYWVLNSSVRRPGTRGDDVDDAAHRVVAVEARARPVDHLDAIDALERHARPIHPAAERIVERHAVDQHQRAADAARADAAQRDALRGRMRRQAAGAAEQAERRHLPQHVVGNDGGRLPDGFLLDDVGADGNVAEGFSLRVGVTVTVSNNVAILRTTLISFEGATDADHSANPPARTTIVRLPPGTPESVKRPSGPVTVCSSGPLVPSTLIDAPETAPPASSRTTPETADWAAAAVARAREKMSTKAVRMIAPY